MARTESSALLTVQHRRAQIALRAATMRDYIKVWPLWRGDAESFQQLVSATIPVVKAHHRLSAALAAAYYGSFRHAEKPGGHPTPRLAALNVDSLTASLYVTGKIMTGRAIAAGQSPQAAMQTALVRSSGTVGRLVLAGGRDTLVQTVREDPRAIGYERVVDPGACDFCQELAGHPSAEDFEAHDHCGCSAEPVFQ